MRQEKFIRRSEVGSLAPIAAVSFLCSEAEQKDLAESGRAVPSSSNFLLQKKHLLNYLFNNSL